MRPEDTIRQVQSNDIHVIQEMQAEWHQMVPDYNPCDEVLLPQVAHAFFLMAERGGKAIGFAWAIKANGFRLEELFVREDFRKDGVGGELLRAILTEAKREGVSVCKLKPLCNEVDRPNLVQFYEKHGFKFEEGSELMSLNL